MHNNIHLAIPHYNAPDQLRTLLGQVRELDVDSITVLDDASKDRDALTSIDLAYPDVDFFYGDKNRGAGGNRNRIMERDLQGIIWFLDVDMSLESRQPTQVIRRLFAQNPNIGMLGGHILTKDGEPMWWNYGHQMHTGHDEKFGNLVAQYQDGDATAWRALQEDNMDYAWIDPKNHPPRQRDVDWVAEGCFAIDMALFKDIGGYDQDLRYHEGQALAHQVRALGKTVTYTPDFVARHLEIDVRGEQRQEEIDTATALFVEKYTD